MNRIKINRNKNINKKGFSIVEMLVALVIVSILLAAFIPVMTKKTKNKSINISSSTSNVCTKCTDENCKICECNGACLVCKSDYVFDEEEQKCEQCSSDDEIAVDNKCVKACCAAPQTIHHCPEKMEWDETAQSCKCKEGETCDKDEFKDMLTFLQVCLTGNNTARCGMCCQKAKVLGYPADDNKYGIWTLPMQRYNYVNPTVRPHICTCIGGAQETIIDVTPSECLIPLPLYQVHLNGNAVKYNPGTYLNKDCPASYNIFYDADPGYGSQTINIIDRKGENLGNHNFKNEAMPFSNLSEF